MIVKFFMLSIATLLSRIPDEAKPLASLAIGSLIMVCLVVLHGAGLYYVLRSNLRAERRLLVRPPHVLRVMFLFAWSVFLMMALHVSEIMVWALSLTKLGLIARVHDAIYFCANSYTTLGYGSVALEPGWRSIAPIIAISGLFAFALTTSTLVDVVKNQRALIAHIEDKRSKEPE